MTLGRTDVDASGRKAGGAPAAGTAAPLGQRPGRKGAFAAAVLAVFVSGAAAHAQTPPAPAGTSTAESSAAGPTDRRSTGDTTDVVWFPDRTSFDPLLAAPREIALRGGFNLVDREDSPRDFEGTNIEADVAIGHRMGVVRLQGETDDRPEVTLGLEVGIFTRFFMETPEKDLINADFRVGAPVSTRWRGWTGRLTLLHVSSHLGDDFVNRFDPPPRQATRDGFELLVGRRIAPGARVYAGGEWNFHVNPGVERTAARAGVEWDPEPGDRRPSAAAVDMWPFVAADARITSLTDEVAGRGVGGLAVRVRGVVLRLEAQGRFGPSALGQLRTRDETSGGVGLRVEP